MVAEAEMLVAEGEGMWMALGGRLKAMYEGTDIVLIWCQRKSKWSFSVVISKAVVAIRRTAVVITDGLATDFFE